MKCTLIFLILLLALGVGAQDGKKPNEPASLSVFYSLDSSGQLVALEFQEMSLRHQYHSLGFAGGTTVYLVKSGKSPVRLAANSKQEFVVKLAGKVDPLEAVQLYRFSIADNSRVMPLGDFDAFGRPSKDVLERLAAVDFNAEKHGVSSFKLIPIQALLPGEYCLVVKAPDYWPKKSPSYCFGVDAK